MFGCSSQASKGQSLGQSECEGISILPNDQRIIACGARVESRCTPHFVALDELDIFAKGQNLHFDTKLSQSVTTRQIKYSTCSLMTLT